MLLRKLVISIIALVVLLNASIVACSDTQPYKYRMVWMWEYMDANLTHVVKPSFFTREELKDPESVPRFVNLCEFLQSINVNALAITVDFNDHNFVEITEEMANLSELLAKYEIDMYLHVPYGFYIKKNKEEKQPYPECPYEPEFAAYWTSLADKLFTEVPLLKGYVMKGMGYEGIPGPLSGKCPGNVKYSNEERMLKALDVLSQSVRPYDGRIFYRTWTTGAMQDVEYHVFKNLAGKIPDNIVVVSKKGYGDFSVKEFPHPLFGHIHPKSEHVAEFQLYGEYRGSHFMPCEMVTWWREWLDQNADNVDGLMGIAEFDRETFDHPLNMVNYYAFGRYLVDPQADADKIIEEWAEKKYGCEAAPVVTGIVEKTDDAVLKLMYYKGAWTQLHSYIPTRGYIDSHLRGPWVALPRDETKFGWGRPLNVFDEKTAEKYAKDPEMKLFTQRVEITDELLDDIVAQQKDGLADLRKMLELLQNNKDKFRDKDYDTLHDGLVRNVNDARMWVVNTQIYFHWLQGKDYSDPLAEMKVLNKLPRTKITTTRAKAIINDYEKRLADWKKENCEQKK